jgi:hypothetical protein
MKDFWYKFRKGLFTKSQFVTGVTITLVTTSALVYAFNQLSLNIFSSGTTISATEVNANFEYLNERIKYLAGYQFALGTPYDDTTEYITAGDTITVDFDEKIADFTDNGEADGLVANGMFTIVKSGSYTVSYEVTGAPQVIGTDNAYGSVFMEVNTLGTSTFAINYSGGFNFNYSSYNANITTNGGGVTSYTAGDVVRFRMGYAGYAQDGEISKLEIKFEEVD